MVKHSKHQVIIGNSAAAISAIKSIRKVDSSCPLTLISAENYYAYSPVLTTYYISGKISKNDLFIVDKEFYQKHNVKVIMGKKAVGFDADKQIVYIEDGSKVNYDTLLIATGATPRFPDNVSPDALGQVFTLRTIEDAERIKTVSREAKKVVFIGGGLVSLQVANAIYKKGVKFTFVVSSKQILSRNINYECAKILQEELAYRGISILLGRNVKQIVKKQNRVVLVSNFNEELDADMIIVGKGVRPNIEFIKNSNVNTNRGIIVDECMRTNIENIFAAGDVAEGKDLVTGKMELVQTWPDACYQGSIAGFNMVGYQKKSPGSISANITHVFGLTIASVGLVRPTNSMLAEELKFWEREKKIYRRILLGEGKILGAVLVGKVKDVGLIRNAIERSTDISLLNYTNARDTLTLSKLIFSKS